MHHHLTSNTCCHVLHAISHALSTADHDTVDLAVVSRLNHPVDETTPAVKHLPFDDIWYVRLHRPPFPAFMMNGFFFSSASELKCR